MSDITITGTEERELKVYTEEEVQKHNTPKVCFHRAIPFTSFIPDREPPCRPIAKEWIYAPLSQTSQTKTTP
jgi:hypothetical protein